MYLKNIKLSNFKSYSEIEVEFSHNINCLVGNNGVGKTNLLEALVYLSCGKSPRARTDKEMIRFDASSARMMVQVNARERDFKVQVDLFRDKRRKMSVNQVPAKNSAALSEVYNTVFFCPRDWPAVTVRTYSADRMQSA